MTEPTITITVHGNPAPQGSKRHVGGGRMVESSKHVKPWREAVKEAAANAMEARNARVYGGTGHPPLRLDGPVTAAMVFTVRDKPLSRPTWWPSGARWSRLLWWLPASTPDLSKLLRATEDALTDAGVWRDDARVVRYRDLAKVYVGDPSEPDALPVPGAVIRVWRAEVAR